MLCFGCLYPASPINCVFFPRGKWILEQIKDELRYLLLHPNHFYPNAVEITFYIAPYHPLSTDIGIWCLGSYLDFSKLKRMLYLFCSLKLTLKCAPPLGRTQLQENLSGIGDNIELYLSPVFRRLRNLFILFVFPGNDTLQWTTLLHDLGILSNPLLSYARPALHIHILCLSHKLAELFYPHWSSEAKCLITKIWLNFSPFTQTPQLWPIFSLFQHTTPPANSQDSGQNFLWSAVQSCHSFNPLPTPV